ncbi:MAG: SRPBCC family protein [Cocleimonas sp.]
MKFLKNLLIGVTLLLVVLAVGSFLLPQKQHVERHIEISASAAKIYPHLAKPKLFHQWSPWSKIDPKMKVEYSGAEMGEGASMSWQSENSDVGSGSWTITKAVKNKSLDVAMDFGDEGGATSFFKLEASAENSEKTTVTWGFDTDAGMNPIMRWLGLMMDKMVGSEYAKGLASLKKKVEK